MCILRLQLNRFAKDIFDDFAITFVLTEDNGQKKQNTFIMTGGGGGASAILWQFFRSVKILRAHYQVS